MKPVKISLDAFPKEPPVGSVILDPQGRAWQLLPSAPGNGAVWFGSFGGGLFTSSKTWEDLLVAYKTLTLIYRASHEV